MDDAITPKLQAIRMLFELDREDDPLLYDDLVRFKKGTKRINRLRLLAHQGVVGQVNVNVSAGVVSVQAAGVRPATPATDSGQSGAAFDMPVAADVFSAPHEQ